MSSTPARNDSPYDALLLVSFGGPEGPDDVLPFLENVLRGRRVPRERMLEVAEHYQHFGGVSPINAQNRGLIAALEAELRAAGVDLPIHFGNRNWHPLLTDTLGEMREAGVRRALAVMTSSYSSYSGCRQYREDVAAARGAVGADAPAVDKVRVWYNHPGFIAANADRVREAAAALPASAADGYHLVFTAHSIPVSMAEGCDYEKQLTESGRLVAEELGVPDDRWSLVYQSRSGRPQDPWLEPDVCDHLETLSAAGVPGVTVLPLGFISDHIEVLFDLDDEAAAKAAELDLPFARAATVGTHPRFVAALRGLIEERLGRRTGRTAVGRFGPNHDVCPAHCCPNPYRGRP